MNPAVELQRFSALERANEIRMKRAAVKRELKAGSVSLAHVLRSNKWYMETMSIRQLLIAVPGLGKTKVNEVLKELHYGPNTEIGKVPARKREELLQHIDHRHPGVGVYGVERELVAA